MSQDTQRGSITLTDVDGQDYTMVLDVNALCLLEEHFEQQGKSLSFVELLQKFKQGSIREVRALVWASLQRHHKGLTLEQAGDVIHAVGGIVGLSRQMESLLGSTNPDDEDAKELAAGSRPLKAQPRKRKAVNGTGGDSKLTAERSV